VSITASYIPFVLKGIAEAAEKQETDRLAAVPPAGDPAANTALQLEMKPEFKPTQLQLPGAPPPVVTAATTPRLVDFLLLAAVLFGFAFAAPFLSGASNIIGILIIGIALYEAWKLNKRVPVSGPFQFAAEPPTPDAPTSPLPPAP
jgi:hypothetical protein